MNKTFPEPQYYSNAPRPKIQLHDVESSQVRRIGYDDESQTLAVQFKHGVGSIYHYPNVSRETFEAFKNADSIGKFFGQNLKTLPFEKFFPEEIYK